MRSFIHINANDYFGCGSPNGNFIQAEDEMDAIEKAQMVSDSGEGWNDFWEEIVEESDLDLSTNEKKMAYLKDHEWLYGGDGGPQQFLFELVGKKMVLVLG